MVGFLKYVGYPCEEVLKIIDKHCQWSDYNPCITAYQVSTVFKQPLRKVSGNGNSKRRSRKWDLSPLEVAKIRVARSREVTRRLTAWMRDQGVAVFSHSGEFDPSKLGGL